MSTPPQPPTSNPSKPSQPTKPTYISSSGHTLDSLPLTARLNRAADTLYNAVGLYFVSLLSLDPYSAAQNSRFNTRGPGRNVNAARSTGTGSAPLGFGSARLGGGAGAPRGGGAGGGGGAGSGSGSGSGTGGRRMGTVDDVRGPECGSCG